MKAYFRVYRNRFWRLTLFNIVYFCVALPLLLVLYICLNAYTGINVGDSAVADVLPGLGFFISLFPTSTLIGRVFVLISVAIAAVLFGTMKTVLYRTEIEFLTGNYRFFADVLSDIRKKLSQTFVIGLLDLLVLGRTVSNLCGVFGLGWPPAVSVVIRVFSLIVLLFWLAFRRWVYLLSAACELRLRPILKNSFLLTVSGLGRTSLCTAACALIWGLTFLTLPLATVILLPLLSYSASSLATVCSLYPYVEEHIIK